MAKLAPLGIKRIDGIHWYVRNLERSWRFYVDCLDFAEAWRSSPALEAEGRQRSAAFVANDVTVVCSPKTKSDTSSARLSAIAGGAVFTVERP